MKKISPHLKDSRQLSPWRRRARYFYLRFVRLQGDPQAIARGVAIGIFVGITPTIPFHTISVLLAAIILRGSKIAALLSSLLVSNPLTIVPQYYLAWKIGNLITPGDLSWSRIKGELSIIMSDASFSEILSSIGKLGMETIIGMVLGGCLLAVPFSLIGFWISRRFFSGLEKKRLEKQNRPL